jgi:hypothetical protein
MAFSPQRSVEATFLSHVTLCIKRERKKERKKERKNTWCSNPPNYFTDCLQVENEYHNLCEMTEKLSYLFWFERITNFLII